MMDEYINSVSNQLEKYNELYLSTGEEIYRLIARDLGREVLNLMISRQESRIEAGEVRVRQMRDERSRLMQDFVNTGNGLSRSLAEDLTKEISKLEGLLIEAYLELMEMRRNRNDY